MGLGEGWVGQAAHNRGLEDQLGTGFITRLPATDREAWRAAAIRDKRRNAIAKRNLAIYNNANWFDHTRFNPTPRIGYSDLR